MFLNGSHLVAATGIHGQDLKGCRTLKKAALWKTLIFLSRWNCKTIFLGKNLSADFLILSLSCIPSSEGRLLLVNTLLRIKNKDTSYLTCVKLSQNKQAWFFKLLLSSS